MQDATRYRFGLLAGLVSGLIVGCDDVRAEPIVTFGGSPGMSGSPGTSGGGGSSGGATDGGGSSTGGSSVVVLGLCDPCQDNVTCGDLNDYCIRINLGDGNPATGVQFCARDCDEGGGCPAGYGCNQTDRGSSQCAPQTGNCSHRDMVEVPPDVQAMRALVLPQLNAVRTAAKLPLLVDDPELDQLATDSTIDLGVTGSRFGKYDRECRDFLPDCTAGWAGEQQFQFAEFGLVWTEVLNLAVAQSKTALGTSGSVELTLAAHTRVGIGILIAGDEAFVSFTYGP